VVGFIGLGDIYIPVKTSNLRIYKITVENKFRVYKQHLAFKGEVIKSVEKTAEIYLETCP
jgi:hypothetical protein